MDAYDLRRPTSDADWDAYHAIRRRVLFELRGRGDAYDAKHPDDHRPNNHPFVLWRGAEPLGVIRVDVDGDTAIFRRVAVRDDAQRHGHGREMLVRAERFAQLSGCTRIDSYVDLDAVGFYGRCGFAIHEESPPRATSVLMTKRVARD